MMIKGNKEWTATERALLTDAFGLPQGVSQWDVERQMMKVEEVFGRQAVRDKVKRVELRLGHKIGE